MQLQPPLLEEPLSFSFSSSLLEPTPLGPQGIQPHHVVDEISLTESGKRLIRNDILNDQDEMFSVLSHLLDIPEGEDINEKQQQRQQRYHHNDKALQNHHSNHTNQNEESNRDITMMVQKLPDHYCITSNFDIFNSSSSLAGDNSLVHANTNNKEDRSDTTTTTTTEVSDLVLHALKQKFQESAIELSPSTLAFIASLITTSSSSFLAEQAPSNKQQRNMDNPSVHSLSPVTACASHLSDDDASKTRNPGVIIPDDGLPCIDKTPHNQEQFNHEIDSSNLALNGHNSDSSSCSSGDDIAADSSTTMTTTAAALPDERRFRSYQCDQWKERFQDLVDFKDKHGHCLVPYDFPPNQHLAQWIKRQRYQYKLKNLGRHTTLTDERQAALEQIGFIWDSHKASWMEHFESLKEFKAKYGDCLVPSDYLNHSLAVWVKCQRRQYKLLLKGYKSAMTRERFLLLESLGFAWNPRNLKLKL